MKLGIHAYAWCSQWSNETLPLIDKVKQLVMDFIEIPLMCLEMFDANAIKKHLQHTVSGLAPVEPRRRSGAPVESGW